MIEDISKIKIGDKVHYLPEHKVESNEYENGIIKEIPEDSLDSVRVVYNCGGDWKHYQDYTSCLTNIRDLFVGWNHSKTKEELLKEQEDEW